MIKDSDFKRFQDVGWKFKGVEVVVSSIRANVSRIWSDLPALLRNANGEPIVKKLIDPLYKDILKSCAQINTLPVKYNKLMKEVIKKLHSIGAFINNPYVRDAVAEKVAESEMIGKTIDEIFENVKNKLNIKESDIDITKPNVIEIYIISQAKIDTSIIFLEECRNYILNIINTSANAGISKSEEEFFASIKKTMEDTSVIISDFIEKINKLKDFFEEQIGNVINTLNELLIEVSIDDSRKLEIINQVKACELYNTLATAHQVIKPNDAFRKLMGNRKEDQQSKTDMIVTKNDNQSNSFSDENKYSEVVLDATK